MRRLAPVVRVVVAETRGSVPREVGASMLISERGVEGTIGGGALEFEAIARAGGVLEGMNDRLDRVPLGPGVGQCSGGAVTLLTEYWDVARLEGLDDHVVRALPGSGSEMPLVVRRSLAEVRNGARAIEPGIVGGWMIEPVSKPIREIWIWGAGHVGRAIVGALAPLPGVRITWADCDASRFPENIPVRVQTLIAGNPADLVTLAPVHAEHLVLTYSHALDLELCHRLLGCGFLSLGLIGSATKWARFRSRLRALGHGAAQIGRITCPIGDPSLGKHPQVIALGVAAEMLKQNNARETVMGREA